jgi:hypothetical protein
VITADADPQAALEGLVQLCGRAYRDLKSVPKMIAIAWEAIGFALMCAAASPDAESATGYKARARAIAYNAGANCWPGWSDPVEINSAEIAEGLKLAERSFELVEELGLGDKATGGALWLVGAIQMAAGRLPEAVSKFRAAEEAFRAAHLATQATMAQGYGALARKLEPGSFADGSESLSSILLSLRAMGSDDALFFANQLVTADQVFSSR